MENKLRSKAEQQADEHSCKLLLNCYIRELGSEQTDHVQLNPDTLTYTIAFPASNVRVTGLLSYYSAMGEHEYLSMNCNGQTVHYRDLVRWISSEIGGDQGWGAELVRDFAQKVENSVANLTLYLEHASDSGIHDYITSEQSLLYGHPFHPFPKSSSGFSAQDVQQYSPELRTSFQLCYIAVRKDVYAEEWVQHSDKIDLPQLLENEDWPVSKKKLGMYGLLPMHPWQYAHISRLDEVQSYIREEKILLLGSAGPLAYPTSSVRTVYVPEWDCNIKLSLNMQITNMIRTNSAEQMRRTLYASRYVWQQGCFDVESQTHIAYEIGVATCKFEDEDLTSLFTIAFRPIEFDPANTYVLSSLVESSQPGEPSRLVKMLSGKRDHGDVFIRDKAQQWLSQYLACSLLPLVRAAGEKGIHFEAHLQNTLVTLEQGMPVAFIVRDLEGVSVDEQLASGFGLLKEQSMARSSQAGENQVVQAYEQVSEQHHRGRTQGQRHEWMEASKLEASELLFYPREKAWARTSYYFIVNHLGSLIHVLARDMNVPEEHYWMQVREVLEEELARTGNAYVEHLLTADAFLAKQNLVSCLTGISQTPAYVPVGNVMKRLGSEVRGIRGNQN
ncbi:IucA/IucC family protein [Paenibacillus sp. JJ-100]|uniref:IucA/IucC family protein n=1 Tax=Paenibacillus sp. JJ-100 TaxID=2974896 RepID=UPI00232FC8DD|nr:IucA/IucC family protein [Paenibacillus sp. JJ-100]